VAPPFQRIAVARPAVSPGDATCAASRRLFPVVPDHPGGGTAQQGANILHGATEKDPIGFQCHIEGTNLMWTNVVTVLMGPQQQFLILRSEQSQLR
jgi:hypothetical protein